MDICSFLSNIKLIPSWSRSPPLGSTHWKSRCCTCCKSSKFSWKDKNVPHNYCRTPQMLVWLWLFLLVFSIMWVLSKTLDHFNFYAENKNCCSGHSPQPGWVCKEGLWSMRHQKRWGSLNNSTDLTSNVTLTGLTLNAHHHHISKFVSERTLNIIVTNC